MDAAWPKDNAHNWSFVVAMALITFAAMLSNETSFIVLILYFYV